MFVLSTYIRFSSIQCILKRQLWTSGKTFAFASEERAGSSPRYSINYRSLSSIFVSKLAWAIIADLRAVNLGTRVAEYQGCNCWGKQLIDGCSLELCVAKFSVASSGIATQKLIQLNCMTLSCWFYSKLSVYIYINIYFAETPPASPADQSPEVTVVDGTVNRTNEVFDCLLYIGNRIPSRTFRNLCHSVELTSPPPIQPTEVLGGGKGSPVGNVTDTISLTRE